MAKKTRARPTTGKSHASQELKTVIADLVIANRILYAQDVVDGYGHVSARHPHDPQRFLMSRARAPGLVTVADILEFGLDGELIKPDARPVYQERFIHSEVYRARPDVHAVVHSHSPTVVPFSVTQAPLKPIRAGFLYPEVPIFDTRAAAGWTNLLISSPALGKALAQTLGENSVALLLQAKMLGGPITYLPPQEAALMEKSQSQDRPGHGSDRTWEMWKQEALKRTGKL